MSFIGEVETEIDFFYQNTEVLQHLISRLYKLAG